MALVYHNYADKFNSIISVSLDQLCLKSPSAEKSQSSNLQNHLSAYLKENSFTKVSLLISTFNTKDRHNIFSVKIGLRQKEK